MSCSSSPQQREQLLPLPASPSGSPPGKLEHCRALQAGRSTQGSLPAFVPSYSAALFLWMGLCSPRNDRKDPKRLWLHGASALAQGSSCPSPSPGAVAFPLLPAPHEQERQDGVNPGAQKCTSHSILLQQGWAMAPGRIPSQGSLGTGRSRRRAGAGLGWPQQLLEQSRCRELTPGLGGSAPSAASTEQLSLPSRGTGNVQQVPLKNQKPYKTIWVINKRVTWSLWGAAVLARCWNGARSHFQPGEGVTACVLPAGNELPRRFHTAPGGPSLSSSGSHSGRKSGSSSGTRSWLS